MRFYVYEILCLYASEQCLNLEMHLLPLSQLITRNLTRILTFIYKILGSCGVVSILLRIALVRVGSCWGRVGVVYILLIIASVCLNFCVICVKV